MGTDNSRHALLEKLSRDLAEKGKLIEAGRLVLRREELDEMRIAYFLEAQRLFATMLTILERGENLTQKDLHLMNLINSEVDELLADISPLES